MQRVEAMRLRSGDFRIVEKETSWPMRAVYYLLFMPLWRPDFLTGRVTRVGTTVYVPAGLYGTAEGHRQLARVDRWRPL